MKYILSLLLPIILFSAEPDKKLHDKNLYPTVKITYAKSNCDCEDCKKKPPQAIATGFLCNSFPINNDLFKNKFFNVVITAAHTVESNPTNLLVHIGIYEDHSDLKGFEFFPAMLYGMDQSKDLAILTFITDKAKPTVDLDFNSKFFFGTDVFKIGYGLGDDPRLDFGQITSIETKIPERLRGFVRTNAYTIFGDSGGPLFLKENGKTIGVASSIRGSENTFLQKQSYFSPIGWLKIWDEESKGSLSFIYNNNKKIPETLMFQMWLKDFEIKGNRQ